MRRRGIPDIRQLERTPDLIRGIEPFDELRAGFLERIERQVLQELFRPRCDGAYLRMAFFDGFIQKLLELRVEKVFRNGGLVPRQCRVNFPAPYGSHHMFSVLQNQLPGARARLGKDIFEGDGNSGLNQFVDIRFHRWLL
jgi:hypothetical protein